MQKKQSRLGVTNIVAAVIIIVVLALIGTVIDKSSSKNSEKSEVAGIETQLTPIVQKTISYDGQDGKNALDLLKEKNEVKVQESSVGTFVTSIDGMENTSDTFWMFYVNGQLAPVSASEYQTKSGEKIEWRFEQFQG